MKALVRWWDSLTDAERVQWTAVAGAVLLYGIHSVLWSHWLIEDSAITYAYARNAALGEGWVPFPGGEPVEGFSNPTWTALLATLRFVGISPWLAAPLISLVLGAVTLPLAFLWAREATGDDGLLPTVAPLWLAVSPQYVVWVGSGLENPLWIWLLTVGSLAFLREHRTGGVPWSALPMGLLAITRPEGALYVATMTGVGVVLNLRNPRALGRLCAFVAGSASIWLAYLGYRYAVFAWPFPNTYYAKLTDGQEHFLPLAWSTTGSGWSYLRSWAAWSTWGFLLPLVPLIATGTKGWRARLGLGFGAVLLVLLIPGAYWLNNQAFWPLAEPTWWIHARIGALGLLAFAVPWLGLGREGAPARILAWILAATMFAYTIVVGADWMAGYRWISHAVVPLSVLLADLLVTLAGARPWADPVRARLILFGIVGGAPLAAGAAHSGYLLNPTETTPFDVARRAFYMNQVQERLHLDHPVTYDIDMGANMWWSKDRIVDVAGLIDMPVAHHTYQRPFIREYVLREVRPDFAHAHGHWRRLAGLDSQPVFIRDWMEIDDYIAGPSYMHVGNHIRKDILVKRSWEGGADPVVFGGRVQLEGLQTPAPVIAAGQVLYVEVGWRSLRERLPPFRPLVVLSNGEHIHSWELPPAYDWLPTTQWRRHEVIHGYHSLSLPTDLPPGDWDLAVVLLDRATGVLPADRPSPSPAFADGEVLWTDRITVTDEAGLLAHVGTEVDALKAAAAAGDCSEAVDHLQRARRPLPADHPDQPWARTELHGEIARCFARKAEQVDAILAEGFMGSARTWNHRDPEVRRIGHALADEWEAAGDEHWAAGRIGPAYGSYKRTLAADPHRPHVRRRLEEARDIRLGLKE